MERSLFAGFCRRCANPISTRQYDSDLSILRAQRAMNKLRGGAYNFQIKASTSSSSARFGDARIVQHELPSTFSGSGRGVRRALQHRPSDRCASARRVHELAASFRPAPVARDSHRSVSASGRHPQHGPRAARATPARQLRPAMGQEIRDRALSRRYRPFKILLGGDLDEDPFAEIRAGRPPKLKALRLHNGTVYRWEPALLWHHRQQAAPTYREPVFAVGSDRHRRGRERGAVVRARQRSRSRRRRCDRAHGVRRCALELHRCITQRTGLRARLV